MIKNKFNFRKVLGMSALLIAGYTHAQQQGQQQGEQPDVPILTVTTGTTHCTTTQDDCMLAPGGKISVSFTITPGDLVQFTAGDFRARLELYRGDWTSQGLAGHIVSNELIYPTPRLSATRTVANVNSYSFTTLSFFGSAQVFNVTKNGTYRAKTVLQQLISGTWTDVFTTPLSPIYGALDQPPYTPWGDMKEVAFIENLKIGTDFNYSVNGLYQTAGTVLTVATCTASPLTLKNITGTMGNPGSATLTIEKGTLTGTAFSSLSSTITTFNAENTNDLNLTSAPFLLGGQTGAFRITYRLPDDVCNSIATAVVKSYTISVVTAAFLDNYKALTPATTGTYVCSNPNTEKDIALTIGEIATTMPTNANFNMFQCALRGSKGWQGASSVGIKGTFTGSYSIDVYEVNASGVRESGTPSIYLNSGAVTPGQQSVVSAGFNSVSNGAAFDATAQYSVSTTYPADITGNGEFGGNFFYEYYRWAKNRVVNNIDLNALTKLSAKIFCVEVNQYPAGGCVVSKKSFFRIANNGTGSLGQNARLGSVDGETEDAPEYMSLNVFPNPTSGLLNIPLNADDKNVQVIITDNIGKEVIKTTNLESNQGILNIETLPAGIYFYNVIKNNTSYKGKIVKQ